jgi:DNA-binding transcriptional LysR family regulator
VPRSRFFNGSVEAACDAACAGIGITSAFAYHFRTDLERGASRLDEFQPTPLPVNLVYTANRFLPIKVRAFLDFAARRLKRIFAELEAPAFQVEQVLIEPKDRLE